MYEVKNYPTTIQSHTGLSIQSNTALFLHYTHLTTFFTIYGRELGPLNDILQLNQKLEKCILSFLPQNLAFFFK